jgi:hypothetical protein
VRRSGNRGFLQVRQALSLAWASYRSLIADVCSRLPDYAGFDKLWMGVRYIRTKPARGTKKQPLRSGFSAPAGGVMCLRLRLSRDV